MLVPPLVRRLVPLAFPCIAACGPSAQPDLAPADSAAGTKPVSVEQQVLASAAVRADSAGQEIRSVRTSLDPDDCTTVSVDEEGGGSTQRCPGTAGWTLLALDGDARASITLVDPAGREHPLDYWSRVTGAFTSLGDEAEWRVRGEGPSATPIALITTLLAHEHPDDPERISPYRVISKSTPTETCVTHALDVIPDAAEVRRLADASASAPCRKSYSEPE